MTTPPCSYDPELWFSRSPADTAAAKAICLRCPLLDACRGLLDALRPEFGVWAGVAPVDRPGRAQRGRPPVVRPTDVKRALRMRARGFTTFEAARELGVNSEALQKAIERARERVAA